MKNAIKIGGIYREYNFETINEVGRARRLKFICGDELAENYPYAEFREEKIGMSELGAKNYILSMINFWKIPMAAINAYISRCPDANERAAKLGPINEEKLADPIYFHVILSAIMPRGIGVKKLEPTCKFSDSVQFFPRGYFAANAMIAEEKALIFAKEYSKYQADILNVLDDLKE